MGWQQAGATARRQVETPASAHQRALWAAVAELSSITSLSSSAAVSRQQTAANWRPRHGLEKKAKKTVPEHSVHSGLLEHTHQAAVIHAVAVVGVSQDFLHFPPASPAFCFIR